MKIETSQGHEILNLADWAKLYDTPKSSHQWKEHRSAYSAAEFIMNRGGGAIIQSRVSEVLGKPVSFQRAIPELEVRFDEFGRGRVHDIGIFGTTDSGESVFVGVEAKVDETFGNSVHDAYLAAKAKQIVGLSTKAPERIEKLLSVHFSKPDIAMFDVRYQLLYATIGTLAAQADISIFYVIVFKTPLYNESIGSQNYQDYKQFMDKVGADPLKFTNKEISGYELTLNQRKLTCLHEYF